MTKAEVLDIGGSSNTSPRSSGWLSYLASLPAPAPCLVVRTAARGFRSWLRHECGTGGCGGSLESSAPPHGAVSQRRHQNLLPQKSRSTLLPPAWALARAPTQWHTRRAAFHRPTEAGVRALSFQRADKVAGRQVLIVDRRGEQGQRRLRL